jgi:sarcosine/dimethylglycine N-methyltransferase
MPQDTSSVRGHYEAKVPDDIAARISQVVSELPPGPIDPSVLAGLDQFHIGGLPATTRLAELCPFTEDTRILDAGSGLGGPSRTLSRRFGCQVIGVDLSPSFVHAAALLTDRTDQADRIRFQVGDVLALPFPPASFDAIWTQHVAMNIADRPALYASFRKVLKKGGMLALYDVVWTDPKPDLIYPVPWAETPDTSFLLTAEETRQTLLTAGFQPLHWIDATDQALAWLSQPRPEVAGSTNLSLVMGPRFPGMAANLARNLRESRVGVLMAVCTAV